MTVLLYTYFTSAVTNLETYIEHERFIRQLIMIKTNKKTDQLTHLTVISATNNGTFQHPSSFSSS